LERGGAEIPAKQQDEGSKPISQINSYIALNKYKLSTKILLQAQLTRENLHLLKRAQDEAYGFREK